MGNSTSTVKVAVHGFGNVGKQVLLALENAPDLECLGVVRSRSAPDRSDAELRGVPDFAGIAPLVAARGKPDAVILCVPSRNVRAMAKEYLAAGIHTVDCFDIHGEIPDMVKDLAAAAAATGRVAVTAAGWDPGTDSLLRVLFEAMMPGGVAYTNFGRGRSMGHSVAAKAIPGVVDATAITIPLGMGKHSRLVYVLPTPEAPRDAIRAALAAEPYFSHDPLEVEFVEDAEALAKVTNNGHGVLLERTMEGGPAGHQRLAFDMRIDNPAMTAQIMVASARAAARLAPGSYTLIDIPPVYLLPGERMGHIARLV